MPPKYTDQATPKSDDVKEKIEKSEREDHRMKFVDSTSTEERNSPELPTLNIPFASQTEEIASENEKDEVNVHKDTCAKPVVSDAMEKSTFQFLYEQ